ncbi:SDR family NAD(P)-dependent oxidoreductase [Novosphingobium sp. KN65.2]|uniref:SDR family NAD(P)-dependent oxidoreductase n=1 Tax=Novosphingobium sp. KN65.2 TaxID=1478134 RepID=UPI0005DBADE9|nr:glucose 1-dehydrogenase [Novosphingobium sp. KN65.2]CDO38641.1 2,5-dichloro-2,5-cyclohexadiene-1,4-diol dehydrogenase [Novosphingobium sp. KN65.2]
MELAGKTAFITGAGGGIGRSLARSFANAGANVVITDIREDLLEQTASLVREEGGAVLASVGDLTEPDTAQTIIAAALDTFGALDCAVNNAAFYPPDTPLPDLDEELARKVMDVDFWGVFHCMRAEIKAMRQQSKGSIVNISSGAGILGHPGNAIYSAAKHAVVGIARTAALDHSREGIRVNVICPGMIETPPLQEWLADPQMRGMMTALHPIGRLGQPDEIAEAALWLCSDRSSFVTGAVIPVDGGYTAQ